MKATHWNKPHIHYHDHAWEMRLQGKVIFRRNDFSGLKPAWIQFSVLVENINDSIRKHNKAIAIS